MQQHPTRRSVMATATALTTVGSMGQARAQFKANVIVIGAGLAGLNAALHLQDGGARVVVLEASNRIGGRICTRRDLEGAPEGGAKQVHDSYTRTQARIKELGVGVYKRPALTSGTGVNIGGANVKSNEWPTTESNRLVGDERSLPLSTLRFQVLTKINPLKDLQSWCQPEFQKYDVAFKPLAHSLGVSDEALRIMEFTATSMGLDDVSALHLFRRHKQSQAAEFGSTARFFTTGTSSLPDAIDAKLTTPVQFGKQVNQISQTKTGVEVRCSDGSVRHADFVICTIPFPVLADVMLGPMPSGGLSMAIKSLPSVHATHIHLMARKAFWLDDGFPPTMFTDSPLEMVSKWFDEPGHDSGALLIELRGAGCARFDRMTDAERGLAIIGELARLRPASKGKVDYLGIDSWSTNPLFKGGYHYFKPGQVTAFGASMFAPWGRVHFAGEHLAETGVGLEAAMESSEREARAILQKS